MSWLLAVVACSTPEPAPEVEPTPPSETGSLPSSDTGSATTESGDTGATVPEVPLIGEALAGLCDPPAGGDPPGSGSLHRLTLAGDGDLVCNDGSPPVAYVRAATDPAHADDWVIFLEGGFYCDSWESCSERWCESQHLMTGGGALARPGLALFDEGPANPVGGWNLVLLHYCTSDAWAGRRRDVVLEGEPDFRLHMTGRDVLDQALVDLGTGATSDDGAAVLPPLDEARRVLFGGASAGAIGALHAMDGVASALDAEVVGLIDALALPASDHLEPDVAAAMEAVRIDTFTRLDDLVGVNLDASCEASVPADERYRCGEAPVLMRDHIETPLLVVSDLRDSIIDVDELGGIATVDDIAVANEATLRELVDRHPDFAVWAAACRRHMIVLTEPWYSDLPVRDPVLGGPARTAAEAVGLWGDGVPTETLPAADGTGVTCP